VIVPTSTKAKAQRFPGRQRNGVFVEASRQTYGIGKLNPENRPLIPRVVWRTERSHRASRVFQNPDRQVMDELGIESKQERP
jgi:hypothetical protein